VKFGAQTGEITWLFFTHPLQFSHGAQSGHQIAAAPRCYIVGLCLVK